MVGRQFLFWEGLFSKVMSVSGSLLSTKRNEKPCRKGVYSVYHTYLEVQLTNLRMVFRMILVQDSLLPTCYLWYPWNPCWNPATCGDNGLFGEPFAGLIFQGFSSCTETMILTGRVVEVIWQDKVIWKRKQSWFACLNITKRSPEHNSSLTYFGHLWYPCLHKHLKW